MQGKHFLLKTIYGYTEFRDGQEPLIDSLLEGSDTLGIMPTGGGKSICFQIPAMLSEGITLVISPLISLMSDQVSTLKQLGVAGAYINSSLNIAQQQLAIRNAYKGMYKIIYVAPERLELPEFIAFAQEANISMLIVDEAHCVSQWGHDFRPSYLNIKEFVSKLGKRPPIGAFTATATEQVKNDIILQLGLLNPFCITTGFDRPNLYFEVCEVGVKEKDSVLLNILADLEGKTGIIYCSTRKHVEAVCDKLNAVGYSATRYHAGLEEQEKAANLKAFLYDTCAIMVATNAFGMGIDKSNVSYIIHYNMPKDIESYYQEAGRAGRDGSDAKCILLFCKQDIKIAEFLIENSIDEQENLTEKQKENLANKAYAKLHDMENYARSTNCLRKYILEYFGQKAEKRCGNCSVCVTDKKYIDVFPLAQAILQTVSKLPVHYGSASIIKLLQGNGASKIKYYDPSLPSLGSFRHVDEKTIRAVIESLINDAYLKRSNDKYRVLSAGYKINDFMNLQEYTVALDATTPKPSQKINKQSYPVDSTLFQKLSTWRKQTAMQKGIPPFVIFSNASLEEMSAKKPTTPSALRAIGGVGENKIMNYGFAVLTLIKEHLAQGYPASQ